MRNRLMHSHLGQSTKDGDEPVSPVAIATSVAAHPRRSPFSFGLVSDLTWQQPIRKSDRHTHGKMLRLVMLQAWPSHYLLFTSSATQFFVRWTISIWRDCLTHLTRTIGSISCTDRWSGSGI